MDKLVEHYGIVIGESIIRQVTLGHAQAIHSVSGGFPQGLPEAVAGKQTFVVQTDGTMVPTVRSGTAPRCAVDRQPDAPAHRPPAAACASLASCPLRSHGATMPDTLAPDLLHKMHAWWRAANYLSVGQIYLQDNPLLEGGGTCA